MSKSKKCVIEIWPTTQRVVSLGVDLDGRVMTHTVYADDLEELNSDYINEHFGELQDDAYERGHGVGYQKGFEDGKAQSERGCEGCKFEGRTSGENPCFSCARNANDYWQAKDDKIVVGDEVYCKGDDESDSGVVTWAGKDNSYVMWQDGSAGEVQKDELIKTGRHFDIASILKEMQS